MVYTTPFPVFKILLVVDFYEVHIWLHHNGKQCRTVTATMSFEANYNLVDSHYW